MISGGKAVIYSASYAQLIKTLSLEKHDWITLRETQKKLREGEEVALEILEKEDRKMLEILISFLGAHHYDVVFVRFGMPDHVSHHSRKDEEMEKCHIVMDTLLRSILDSQDYEYLFVVSDHGIKKEDTLFYLNEYLRELKYFKEPPRKRIYASFISLVSRIGGDILAEHMNRRIEWVLTRGRSVFIQEQLPYGSAAAFAFSAIPTHFCPLYVRDPAIEEEVFEKLKQSEYVREVHRIEYDYASSVRREGLEPSALVESFHSISPRLFGKPLGHGYYWFHDMKGIFLVCGKDIRKGCSTDCSIYDIAPTLLHILGEPVPDDLSGKVITEIFEEGSELRKKSVEYMTIGEREREEEKIRESVEALRNMGKI